MKKALFTASLVSTWATSSQPPAVGVSIDKSGVYTVEMNGNAWYTSPAAPTVCVAGQQVTLKFGATKSASGTDKFGAWTGTTTSFSSASPSAAVDLTFKKYASLPQIMVGTASFPSGLDTSKCGSNTQLSTNFPAFDTGAAMAPSLNTLSWRGGVIGTTAATRGLGKLGANALDCGPVVSTEPTTSDTLVWSTLDNHKIVPQATAKNVYSMGIAAAIPKLPSGYSYSVLFSAASGGATAGMYAWGDMIQRFSGTKRLPSITLSDVGYYTDDGAYYYVWGGGKEKKDPQLSSWIPPRPWPAETGLVLVKEALYKMGVPVAYMQLDDWWYQGPFYFGNVKSVVDWHASNSSGLFPSGLPAFADKLGLPLQLYVPFWDDKFETKYRTFESTSFKRTKLVVPDDSYKFFSDWFDLGLQQTNGKFNTFEIDFLDNNFKGCADCFEDVGAADRWYKGLADAALERNISLQFCLPSATDMLASLDYPAVVQARASGDYARPEGNMNPWGNVVTLGGSSLLLGATAMAPSKDTLWTASPQPETSSDRSNRGYRTQPHVELDSILATLSLGPVGISDGLNLTDAALIQQAFRNSNDSTLLRPTRPLSTVDSVWTNISNGAKPEPAPTPGPPAPTPKPKTCTLDVHLGCYQEPEPKHFYAYSAFPKNPNDPTMTREKCAALCGELAAEQPSGKAGVIYAAIEDSDQCRCGTVEPTKAGGKKLAESMCNMACKGDAKNKCGGNWKADVYSLKCTGAGTTTTTTAAGSVDTDTGGRHNLGDGIDYTDPTNVGVAIATGTAPDIRGTHAALSGGGPNSHYILAWMTTQDVTLGATDLYPPPKAGAKLAVRKHIVKPAGATSQFAGCDDGKPAVPACITLYDTEKGVMPTFPKVGGSIVNYGYWSIYEPTSSGAYFLGELEKFVHVSPQRFEYVKEAGTGPCGITVGVKGTPGEKVQLAAVDGKGIVHVTTATLPQNSHGIDIVM